MQKKETTLLDKIIAQGGGPVLGLSLQRYRYKRIF
jgi:hypothetical protein